jgi:hypothetical protein
VIGCCALFHRSRHPPCSREKDRKHFINTSRENGGSVIMSIVIQPQADSTLTGAPATPVGTSDLTITRLGAYSTGSGATSAEVFAYDKVSKLLFVMNNVTDKVEIVDIRNPAAMRTTTTAGRVSTRWIFPARAAASRSISATAQRVSPATPSSGSKM